MNSIAKITSLIALAVTVVPSCLNFFGMIEAEPMKWITLAGTIAWFATTPFWIGRESKADAVEAHT
ncbi:MAG: hypothetical protein AB8B55_21105 [Mariniblastus sp.]